MRWFAALSFPSLDKASGIGTPLTGLDSVSTYYEFFVRAMSFLQGPRWLLSCTLIA